MSMGSLFASLWGFALQDKSGKTASAISLVGSLLSFTMSVAFTLVVGFSEDRYGLAVLSTIFSGISLFTSGYSLSKSKLKTLDVFILSAVSTALSLGSLAISLYTLF